MGAKINDGLSMDISRQRRYQLRRMAEGKCTICAREVGLYKGLCNSHAAYRREYQHKVMGCKRRNRTRLDKVKV